jgi:hypothetical protein
MYPPCHLIYIPRPEHNERHLCAGKKCGMGFMGFMPPKWYEANKDEAYERYGEYRFQTVNGRF